MQRRVLVDTSAWIEALRTQGDEAIRLKTQNLLTEGLIVFCDLVLLELWNGACGDKERNYLASLEEVIEVLPTTAETWELSRSIARKARRAGLTLPATDLLVAACALHHNAEIFHRDRHFDQILHLLEQRPGQDLR